MKTKANLLVMLACIVIMLSLPLANTRGAAQGPSISPSNPTLTVGQTQQFTLSGVGSASSVDVGAFFSCAVLQDGSIRCWGANESGQLGDGTRNNSSIPVIVSGLPPASAVSGGGYHTCARLPDGTIRCWGRNSSGQLGPAAIGESSLVPVPITGISTATSLSAGAFHNCVRLQDGSVRCWGQNDFGQLGDGTLLNSSTPLTVNGIAGNTAVSSGGWHTCALMSNGTVRCWGQNDYGQLGNGSFISSLTPVTVTGISTAVAVDAGIFSTCALLQNGTLQCWGRNDFGNLGNGTTSNSSTPTTVPGVTPTAFAPGAEHTCAVMADGSIRCWGDNNWGQLGNASPMGFVSTLPSSPVTGINSAFNASAGAEHTCAILQGGSLQCWGRNFDGRLGNGTNTDAFTPVNVSGFGVSWTSSNPSVASVSTSGLATALSPGSTTITATSNGGSSATTLTVVERPILSVVQAGAGSGVVTSSPEGINCGSTCSAPFDPGALVTLSASPVAGSVFAGWSGACSGTGPCTVRMNSSTTVTATFTPQTQTFPLTISRSGTGTGTVTSSPAGINCGATCSASYNSGTVVTLTATPDPGSVFAGWSGGCSGSGACSVTMNGATTVTAIFNRQTFSLTVNRSGTGTGTVTSSPAGINCGATCSASYNIGTVVTLTATPDPGSVFAGWSGGCSGTGSCTVTMNGATTVTAIFNRQTFPLTVNRSGTGFGTVTSSPAGINCGLTCTASFDSGTAVTLTAIPAPGSVFAGWSGGCSGTPCTVTMNGATTVTAIFNLQVFPLTVNKTGTGSGTVTSSPAGINCGLTCSASFSSGTMVTLTATPAPGSVFVGWLASGCAGTDPCTVTVNAAMGVSAVFKLETFTLTINKTGTGLGTVTSSPAGINCGPTCSASFDSGALITLTATPLAGSTFAGWSGACSGTGSCTVNIASNTSVTANFVAPPLSAPVLKWQYGGCLAGPYCNYGWYSSPAVSDLDGDSQPDVIWGAYDVVALNGGNGALKWRAPSGSRVWPGIVLADLTGDGTLEVVVGRDSDQLTVYNRFGSVIWTKHPFGGSGELRSLAVADLESDGQLEIIAGTTDESAQFNIYEPNGTVRAGWPARHPFEPGFGWGLYNQNVAVADMNGDGFKEIFGAMAGHYITALDRSGGQLRANAIYNNVDPFGPKVWSQVGVHVDHAVDLRGYANCGVEHRPNFADSAPVVADVNGDGVLELILVGSVYNCDTYTDLYCVPFILKADRTRWSGSGFDWTVIPTPGPGSGPRSVDYNVIETAVPNPAVADLDGDGFKEIIYPCYDGKVHAYWLDKTEHGSWPHTVPSTGANGDNFRFASEPLVADLDNDGRAEVIFTSWPKKATGAVGQLHILSYLGVERFRINLPGSAIGQTWNGGLAAPTLANIDSDADLELVVGTVASGVVAYDLPNTSSARVLWGTGRGSYRRAGRVE